MKEQLGRRDEQFSQWLMLSICFYLTRIGRLAKSRLMRLKIYRIVLALVFPVIFLTINTPQMKAPQLQVDKIGQIVFVSTRNGNADIYLMVSNGENVQRISPSDADEITPTWSPDGKEIAFASNRDNGNFHLYIAVMPHGDESMLGPTDESFVGFPSWSPDGTGIAVALARGSTQEICIYIFESKILNCLTSNDVMDTAPSWSPDGKTILFATNRDDNYELYVMDIDGSKPINLTKHEASDLSPSWSPDGKQIAFASDRDGDMEIYTMNADGSHVKQLTVDDGLDDVPSWSPDGKQIAFSSERTENFEIYVMDDAGRNVEQLTNDDGVDTMPVWKPAPKTDS
jgi:Tol biopolymer transport system component